MARESMMERLSFAGWKYAQLAAFFVAFLLVLPHLPKGIIVTSLASLFLLNSLLVADSTSARARSLQWVGWTLWSITTISAVVEVMQFDPSDRLVIKFVGIGAHTLLILACAVTILAVVFRAGRVTIDGIFTSVVAYQLIGLFFAQIYTLIVLADPTALHLPDSIAYSTENFQLEMIYFSFVTLATLGYGDIVPDVSLARSVTIIEAIIGQFYVAVIVAVLVSSFVAQKLEAQAARSKNAR